MHSVWEFLLVALVVTLTPGPATALVLRVSARDGRSAALGAVAGNSVGVLLWASLSAVGVSSSRQTTHGRPVKMSARAEMAPPRSRPAMGCEPM